MRGSRWPALISRRRSTGSQHRCTRPSDAAAVPYSDLANAALVRGRMSRLKAGSRSVRSSAAARLTFRAAWEVLAVERSERAIVFRWDVPTAPPLLLG